MTIYTHSPFRGNPFEVNCDHKRSYIGIKTNIITDVHSVSDCWFTSMYMLTDCAPDNAGLCATE